MRRSWWSATPASPCPPSPARSTSSPRSRPSSSTAGPVLLTLTPSSITAGSAAFVLTLDGLAFVNTGIARWNGQNLATTLVSATRLTAQVPPALLVDGGFANVTVFTPPPSGGTSQPQTFLINNPAPALTSVAPTAVTAGGPRFTVTATGSSFVPSSALQINGTNLATTFVSATSLTGVVPASLVTAAGNAQVRVFNPAPQGGLSGASTIFVSNPAPALGAVAPGSVPAGGPATGITLTGTGFTVQSEVRLDGTPVATGFVSATQLGATLPSSLAAAQAPGGMAIAVENFGAATSNALGLEVTDHQNRGTIDTRPLAPAAGEAFTLALEAGTPGTPFTLVYDLANVPPIVPFPNAAGDLVLSVNPGTMLPLIDGLGIFGPPSLVSFGFDPAGTPPGGVFLLPGAVQPNPPLGLGVTLQTF